MYPGNRFSAPVSRNAAMVADRMKRSAAAAKDVYKRQGYLVGWMIFACVLLLAIFGIANYKKKDA